MSTKRNLLLAALLLTVRAASPSAAAEIALAAPSTLAFGRAVVTSEGTVVVSPEGDRTSTGGVTLIGGSASATSFTVTGDVDRAYSITLSDPATLSSGSGSMTVDTFTFSPTSSSWNLGAGGSQTVHVGATLHVGGSQAQASYTGTYSITVAYQ